MNASKFLLNKGTDLQMALQRLSEKFLALSLFSQLAILCGIAAVFVAVVSFRSRAENPIQGNKSKGERAKEMKQNFLSSEKDSVQHGSASMKVRSQF